MNSIDRVNKLSKSDFISIFGNVFEKTEWIAQKSYDSKPYNNFEELSSRMLNIFETASKEKKLKILNDHPDLGNKAKIGLLTSNSLKEQTSVGLDECTEEEFNEFKKLNNTYKRFGFPFILAIKGKTKIEILNNFRERVSSNLEMEFDEAIKQVKQIASLRLKELNDKDF